VKGDDGAARCSSESHLKYLRSDQPLEGEGLIRSSVVRILTE